MTSRRMLARLDEVLADGMAFNLHGLVVVRHGQRRGPASPLASPAEPPWPQDHPGLRPGDPETVRRDARSREREWTRWYGRWPRRGRPRDDSIRPEVPWSERAMAIYETASPGRGAWWHILLIGLALFV